MVTSRSLNHFKRITNHVTSVIHEPIKTIMKIYGFTVIHTIPSKHTVPYYRSDWLLHIILSALYFPLPACTNTQRNSAGTKTLNMIVICIFHTSPASHFIECISLVIIISLIIIIINTDFMYFDNRFSIFHCMKHFNIIKFNIR